MNDQNYNDLSSIPQKGKLIGLDLGTKTIGVAISDSMRFSATPLETIKRKKFTLDSQRIIELINEYEIKAIILGLPLNMDGTFGSRAQSTISFKHNLSNKISIPIALWDERLSTSAVNNILLEADISRAKRTKLVDKLAATYILQGALDMLRSSKNR